MEKGKCQCIIHYAACDKEEEHLVSPTDTSSWLALLEAAKVRNHQAVLDVAKTVDENHLPNIAYHRKCRSLFTMKRDLESIKRKREGTVDEESNPTKRQCRRPSTERRVYDPVCIFGKKIKFMKNPKSREKLIQAVQLRADTTLRNCAILKNDARILAITSRDIVAMEAHYHASCYKSYTNIKTKERDYVGDKEVENSSQVTDMLSYEVAEVEASREGDWDLHLHSIRMMIPWCFAYDNVNYSRYLTPYFAQMTNLGDKNPEVQKAFKEGSFSVQLSSSNPFGRIPVDQTTEVTVNKDTQNPGGTTRFSLKPATVQRYYLTAEYRSAFLGQLRNMVQGSNLETQHTELQSSRIKKDEQAVSSIVDLIQGWVNPFSESQDLISISTAKKAPREIATDLKTAHAVGERCYTKFKEERMENTLQIRKVHYPLETNKLKTFSEQTTDRLF